MTLICYIHNFQTDDNDFEGWDLHCYSTGHVNEESRQLPNGKWETVTEPYPRHYMRDKNAGMLSFGPFSKEHPMPPELAKALDEDDFDTILRYNKDGTKKW